MQNPTTPNNRSLGAINLKYGAHAEGARSNLKTMKNWLINGDAASETICAAMPVELISFSGSVQENSALLTWETISETSNAGFEIEKSTNARIFEKIGFMDGAVDSKVKKSYHFVDTNLLPNSYYRLKQIDFDGSFQYSRIIFIKYSAEEIVLYPNPTSNVFYLGGSCKPQKLIVRNYEGKVVHKQEWLSGTAVNVGHLHDGLYFISINGETKKVIVQKENP